MTLQEMLVNDRRKIDDIRLSINRKELEYYNYITTHRYNVKYAFIKYGEILVRSFLDDFNGGYTLLYSILENRVSNHDNSKTASSEYDGYRMRFHTIEEEKDFATDDNPKFVAAWKHHYTNNDHHPEYYYIYEDDKPVDVKEIPIDAIIEMALDWVAMGMSNGNSKAYDWYKKVEHDFMMEPKSRKKFEKCLNIIRLYDEELDDM